MVSAPVLARVVAVACLLGGCQTAPRPEPQLVNLSAAKRAVVEYQESGAYLNEVTEVAQMAKAWLRERASARRPGERLAVVFDIDETVLSNLPQMLRQDFGYVHDEWLEWVQRAEAPAIEPMRAVYRVARQLNYDVFFLTGRREPEERAGTELNLQREGLGEYTRLILAPAGSGPASTRKASVRASLEAEGYTIVATIGDQHSDLTGGHAERTFKVPNPFYEIH